MTLKKLQIINRKVELLKLKDSSPKSTLASKPLLIKNTEGKNKKSDGFHHRSAIGSLQCLARCTRPDASMGVYKVAKFSTNPKACHE